MLRELTGKETVERIAILVSYNGKSKFIGAPKVQPSTGENIAAAVQNKLNEWNIANRITAISFDTTSSNTGILNGACTLLQKNLGQKLLYLACRHHVYEIILRAVFELKFGKSAAPEVQIFERFAKAWKNTDQTSFESGLVDGAVRSMISDNECERIKNFCQHKLTEEQSRADYKEFLSLVLHFLGVNVSKFRAPGETSNARWMAKAIYCLKIFLFRKQFKLTARELKALRDICIFLVRMYIQAWIGCTNAIASPNQDFNFIIDAVEYSKVDAAISKIILNKMSNHFWYLCEEAVALSFLDPKVSIEEKRRMVHRLKSENPMVKLQNDRKLTNPEVLIHHTLSVFVSKNTLSFFSRFGLSTKFLDSDPSEWEDCPEFMENRSFCRNLFVVNDTAERGVKFMKDFNRILTNNEEEKQFLLQAVESYRNRYPSYKKKCLA